MDWNPRNWEPWEQVLGAVIFSLVVISAVIVAWRLGALVEVDVWLGTPEGVAVSRAFAIVALILALALTLAGAFYQWLYPFILDRRERQRERIRQVVRAALSDTWPHGKS